MEGTTSPQCLFLDVLPLEIRLDIFKYVLAARFNTYETNMKSEEYASRRSSLLRGPDHSICFNTSILRVNRQIHREAYNVFIQENNFVLITYNAPKAYWYREVNLARCGAVILAEADQARTFPNIGMTIDVKGGDDGDSAANGGGEITQHQVSVIAVEDLSAACVALQWKMIDHEINDQDVEISVTISPHLERVSIRSKDGSPATGSKLHKCLEPLRQLRWVHHVVINGCGNGPYLADITVAMCGSLLSAAETMNLVADYINRGDKALFEGADCVAIDRYKDAIKLIHSSSFHDLEIDEILTDGMFKDVTAAWAREEAEIRLHTRIARILLRKGSHRLARVYVERIYGPLYTTDDRGFDARFPLEINGDNGEAYADLLVVAAQISLSHGQASGAHDELHEASRLDPENKEVKPLLDSCEELLDKYRANKSKEIEKRMREQELHKEAIEIARARNAKGDEAFENNKYMAALRKYEAAYAKLRKTEGHCKNNWSSAATSLAVEILPKLPTVCLEIQDYEGVQYWADVILDFVPGYIYRQNDIDAYMRTARFTAYFSRAFVLQKQGETSEAIQNYEKALSLDGNNYTAIKQLEALKKLEQ